MAVTPYELGKDIYMISVNDLRTRLFESLWDIPEGISYNSYLIVDDKVAILDGVSSHYSKPFVETVKKLLGGRSLDYYIVHHGEPDHSGSFPDIVREFPEVKVLTTEIGSKIIRNLYDVEFKHVVISDGYELSLGRHNLRFVHTPWLHWPDTFMTYLREDKILFSCDAFGAYGALTRGYWEEDYGDVIQSLRKRYFANIVASYRSQIPKAAEKLSKYEVRVIAPSHGPLIRDVGSVLNTYLKWSKPEFMDKVLIVYSTMYGNLGEAVKHVVEGVEMAGAKAVLMKVPETPITYVVEELFDSPAIALVTPTYDGGAFPYTELVLNLMKIKKFEGRYVGLVTSGLWAPVAESKIVKELEEVKAVVGGKVSLLGRPKRDDVEKLLELGKLLGRKAVEVKAS